MISDSGDGAEKRIIRMRNSECGSRNGTQSYKQPAADNGQSTMSDLKFAFRQLVKSPSFTAVAVLTLALGIGANTAIFTVLNALLLRSLPVSNPQELVQVVTRSKFSDANSFS